MDLNHLGKERFLNQELLKRSIKNIKMLLGNKEVLVK